MWIYIIYVLDFKTNCDIRQRQAEEIQNALFK